VLRPYQLKAVAKFNEFLARGKRRGVLVLPTGCGKTRTGLAIVASRRVRTLWIAHRDELLRQPAKQIALVWPEAQTGIVKGAENGCDARDVVFASIQTLARGKRLAECGKFDLVVVDECHHAVAASYRTVLNALGCPVLGLTATPDREGLAQVFEEIFYQLTVIEAIRSGFLCKLAEPVRVELPKLDLNRVATQNGDFAPGQLARALKAAHVARVTASAIARHAHGRKSIAVFTADVEQAQQTEAELRRMGITSATVHAGTSLDERKALLGQFEAGAIRSMCSRDVLTEGYDNPRVDCVVVARPTKSAILYRQMIGRGIRIHDGKPDCLVIDLYGAYDRHDLMSVGKLLDGVLDEAIVKKAKVTKLVEEVTGWASWAGAWLTRLVG